MMTTLRILIYGACLLTSLNLALAEDAKPKKKKAAVTEEQKKARTELLGKYDSNKDGKLSKDERAKISDTADKEKLKKAGWNQPAAKKKDKTASDNSTPVKTQ